MNPMRLRTSLCQRLVLMPLHTAGGLQELSPSRGEECHIDSFLALVELSPSLSPSHRLFSSSQSTRSQVYRRVVCGRGLCAHSF